MKTFCRSLIQSASTSIIYWKVSLMRCLIYGAIVAWGMFRAGTQGYDSLSDMTQMQLVYLFGDMFFAGFLGVVLAFVDNTLSGLGRSANNSGPSPAGAPAQPTTIGLGK